MFLNVYFYIFIMLSFLSGTAIYARKHGLEYLSAAYICLVVAAGFLANKIVSFGPYQVPSASIIASCTFFVTDIISELWGKEQSIKTAKCGMLALILLIVSQSISQHWPCSPYHQVACEKFNDALNQTPRIITASIIAFVISQTLDIHLFHSIRRSTKGRALWMRNNFSTIPAQTIDTIVFVTISFYGIFENDIILDMIVGFVAIKFSIALLDTPFIYLVRSICKKINQSA